MPYTNFYTNGSALLIKRASRALDKNCLQMTPPPEPLVQILNNFTEMLAIVALYEKWSECSAWLNNMENRNIFKSYLFSHRPIDHLLMCQVSGPGREKQCRFRSDGFLKGRWPGPRLFSIQDISQFSMVKVKMKHLTALWTYKGKLLVTLYENKWHSNYPILELKTISAFLYICIMLFLPLHMDFLCS